MITGLREFRKKLSEHITLIKKGQIVIITDRDKPIASLISTNKLRELAKKANDRYILSQLVEAQADKNKEFLERKSSFKKEIDEYIKIVQKAKGIIPNSAVAKLQTIFFAIENLTSNNGTLEDQRMLSLLMHKSRDPISRMLDYDYYHVHKDFLAKVKIEMQKMAQKASKSPKTSKLSNDMKLLANMVDKAIIREKTKLDDEAKTSTFSVLVRVTKNGKYYSSRIYTLMPYWYERGRSTNYFIERLSPLETKIRGKKVKDTFQYRGLKYKILSIT